MCLSNTLSLLTHFRSSQAHSSTQTARNKNEITLFSVVTTVQHIMAKTRLSALDRESVKAPVTVYVHWSNPTNAHSVGATLIEFTATVEKNENETQYKLTITTLTSQVMKGKTPTELQIQGVRGNIVEVKALTRITETYVKPIGEIVITVDHNTDLYTITEKWETVAKEPFMDGKTPCVIRKLSYEDVEFEAVVREYKHVLYALQDFNLDQTQIKNPTVSLILWLRDTGEANFTPVFLEWFEEQFLNPKDDYRRCFGNTYLQLYQELKKAEINN